MKELRDSIDNIDAAIVYLLAERFRITHRVGTLKRNYGVSPADPEREAAQRERLRSIADSAGLDREVVDLLFPVIMEEVRRRHEALRHDAFRHEA